MNLTPGKYPMCGHNFDSRLPSLCSQWKIHAPERHFSLTLHKYCVKMSNTPSEYHLDVYDVDCVCSLAADAECQTPGVVDLLELRTCSSIVPSEQCISVEILPNKGGKM